MYTRASTIGFTGHWVQLLPCTSGVIFFSPAPPPLSYDNVNGDDNNDENNENNTDTKVKVEEEAYSSSVVMDMVLTRAMYSPTPPIYRIMYFPFVSGDPLISPTKREWNVGWCWWLWLCHLITYTYLSYSSKSAMEGVAGGTKEVPTTGVRKISPFC